MKLLLLLYVYGTAPICSFDGYVMSCYYYTWQHCEAAVKNTNMRCVVRP